jgi:hypothetical protein
MTWTKVTWWSDDKHLKKDLRSIIEDPRNQASSRHEVRNQAERQDREETSEEELGSEDRMQPPEGTDASDHVTRVTAASVHAPGAEKARGPDTMTLLFIIAAKIQSAPDTSRSMTRHTSNSVRSCPERFQSDASDRLRPDSPQSPINVRAPMVGRTGRVRSGRI